MTSGPDQTFVPYGNRFGAIIGEHHVFLLPPLNDFEPDHPIRRFVAMKCLVAKEMQLRCDSDPEDDELASYYARAVLIPDEDFHSHVDERDAELAELFNVPLEEVRAKRLDPEFAHRAWQPQELNP